MTDVSALELLVADDDPSVRDLFARAFKNDFKLTIAKDGREAIAFLQTMRPAAILVDEMMPGATGSEVLRYAKEHLPDTPRLLMTASADPRAAMAAVNMGEIHRFYTKPLKLMEVRAALLDLIARARAELALRAELLALRATKAVTSTTRVLMLCDGIEGDQIAAACERRGYALTRVGRVEELEGRLGAGNFDLVVVESRVGEEALREIARLIAVVDEAMGLLLVADDDVVTATMHVLTLAFQLGASDCLVPPLPDLVPLSVRLERAAARPRDKRELRRLTFDLVVANGELALARRRVEEGQVKLLNGLVRALEARDPYTAGHTDRVAAVAVRCAEEIGVTAAQVEAVRIGALLHDVGKIGIRDEVLYKPGRLTPEEFEIIKTHTTIGARILEGIESLACAVPVVRGHHEKLDGTGYPDRLAGAAIPREVRIVSAADVLDAITSTRPYRPASSIDEAFTIMEPLTGPHLDPDILAALRALHAAGRLADLLLQR